MEFEKDLAEFAENDLKELLDTDYYAEALRAAGELDFTSLVDGGLSCGSPGVVLNDRLITEASVGLISQLGSLTPLSSFFPSASAKVQSSTPIKTEHSYSMSEESSETTAISSMDDDLSDLENECYPAISITEAEGSRASKKDPIFTPLRPSPEEEEEKKAFSPEEEEEEEFSLKRHASIDTISCCGDCSCQPDCVLDLSDSLPSSPFPLVGFQSDEDIVILGEESREYNQDSQLQCQRHNHHLCNKVPNYQEEEQKHLHQQFRMQQPHTPLEQPVHQNPQEHHQEQQHNHTLFHHQQSPDTTSGSSHKSSTPSQLQYLTLNSHSTNKYLREEDHCQRKQIKDSNSVVVTHSSTSTVTSVPPRVDCPEKVSNPEDGDTNSAVLIRQNSTSGHIKETGFVYPPTPPSCSSSDSESSDYSPTRSTNPLYERINPPLCNSKRTGPTRTSNRNPIHTHLISSQPKGATGTLYLTEEEKRTLISEGYDVPSKLPLTKAEEKSLKKIRRKIKNKISAQESRRKKKEYMDTLEHKVDLLTQENNAFRRKIESLQNKNNQLIQELERLKSLVEEGEKNVKRSTPRATITS